MPKRADHLRKVDPRPRLANVEPGQRVRLVATVIGGKGYLGGTRVEICDKEFALPDDTVVELAE